MRICFKREVGTPWLVMWKDPHSLQASEMADLVEWERSTEGMVVREGLVGLC